MNSKEVLKLIDAGYTKAEIDALLMDVEQPADGNEKTPEQGTEKATEKETEKTPEQPVTVSTETVSNVALLTAINNLTKVIQENNRNSVTTDNPNGDAKTQTASEALATLLK